MMCFLLVGLTILNYIIPDPLPFVDEIIMTLTSIGVCGRKLMK
jgi:hypothetical protein